MTRNNIHGAFVRELQRIKVLHVPEVRDVVWVRDLAFRTRTRNEDFGKMVDDTLAVVVPRATTERLKA